MAYTDDFIKKMVQFGTLGYPLSKILNVLDDVNVKRFTADFDDPRSEVTEAYQKGVDIGAFIIA